MSDKPSDPFLGVVEGLGQLASDPELAFLVATGWQQGRTSGLMKVLDELAEIRERGQDSITREGDAFRAMRLLLRFSKSELIRLVMELGFPHDEEAILPWRVELKRRRLSNHDRFTEQLRQRVNHRFNQNRKQDVIVRRVMMVRMNRKVNLPEAFRIVAKGEDHEDTGLLGEYTKPPSRSVATVKSYYMAGMRRLKPLGYVEYKAGPLIGGGYRKLYFGDLVKKGRRPRK